MALPQEQIFASTNRRHAEADRRVQRETEIKTRTGKAGRAPGRRIRDHASLVVAVYVTVAERENGLRKHGFRFYRRHLIIS